MSELAPASAADTAPTLAQPSDPKRNPSYPQRVHLRERAHWEGILRTWDARIVGIRQKIQVLGNSPERARYDRAYAQMLGGRDQIAESVRRLPLEVGELYEEDKHRLEEAVAALERLFQNWDKLSGSAPS